MSRWFWGLGIVGGLLWLTRERPEDKPDVMQPPPAPEMRPAVQIRWPIPPGGLGMMAPPFTSTTSLVLLRLGFKKDAERVLRIAAGGYPDSTPDTAYIQWINRILAVRTLAELQGLHGGAALEIIGP